MYSFSSFYSPVFNCVNKNFDFIVILFLVFITIMTSGCDTAKDNNIISKVYTLENTVLESGVFLDKETRKPIKGIFRRYFKSGKVSFENNYINGMMNGVHIKYYPSGKKEYIFNYSNNQIVGKQEYYDEKGKLTIMPAF